MLDKVFDLLDEAMASWIAFPRYLIFILFLAVGVVFLVKFCDIFVDSASSIAKKMHISPLIIGLTVVAIGTSCPELAVSVSDSIRCLLDGGNANVALGNVVGSNICNLLVVLGFSAVFTPIIVKKSICKREYPFMIFISVLLVIFGIFFGINSITGNYAITRWEGIIFVVLIFVYIFFLIYNAKKHPTEIVVEEEESDKKDMKLWLAIILVIVGAVGIALGGEFVVYGAKSIALEASPESHRDLAESLVGLTIVAVGTSLPELVTSIIAAKKGENELALGNVIGSNIFNVVFVLGIAATVNPLTTGSQIIIDLVVMLGATLLVFFFALRGKITKKNGIIMLSCYVLYLVYLVLRTVL
ncbi:MAG: calcium/sodium antiporter [Anaeroplasmataceae bacterium]